MYEFKTDPLPRRACRDGPLLLVVEGANDVLFLKHLSQLARQIESTLSDLASLEQSGGLIFVPFGGGNVLSWSERLAPLECPEFHLLDQEFPPETATRENAIARVNARPHCRGFLTQLPTAEHYLLPTLAAFRAKTTTTAYKSARVSQQIAVTWYHSQNAPTPWHDLPIRKRHRYIQRAKGWLYSHVVPQMTVEHPQAVGSSDEILTWFRTIQALLSH